MSKEIENTVVITDKRMLLSKLLNKKDGKIKSAPASFSQKSLYFLNKLERRGSTYNIPYLIRCEGTLNTNILIDTFNEIIIRHESLRTIFSDIRGEINQMILPKADVVLTIEDLKETPIHEKDRKIEEIIIKESSYLFDLEKDSLMRVSVIRKSEDENIIMLLFHHSIFDGVSFNIFLNEFQAIYNAFLLREPHQLAKPEIQFSDYALWQHEWVKGVEFNDQLSYWKNKLNKATTFLDIPTDYPRTTVQRFQGQTYSFVIPRDIVDKLEVLNYKNKATLYVTLLTAFNVLLYRYSNQNDILVGTPVSGRSRKELEGLIGMFVNTVVIRTPIRDNMSFSELLKLVRQTVIEALDNQDLPFEKLVEELQPIRNSGHNPIFQVMFALDEKKEKSISLDSLTLYPSVITNGTSKFDLNLDIQENEEGIMGNFEYNTDLFKESTIIRMANSFQKLLETISKGFEIPLLEIPILSEEDYHKVIYNWNSKSMDYPKDACVHHFFEKQVEVSPNRISVIYNDQSLTFKELNCRANKLARYLIKQGVSSEKKIVICMDRSVDVVVAILAIWKAGGSYIPIDPSYPSDRILQMIELSDHMMIISQEKYLHMFTQNEIFCMDRDQAIFFQELDTNLISDVEAGNLAYVIYTSGTTGIPKGVMVEHRSLVNLGLGWNREYLLNEDSRFLSVASISFDVFSGDLIKMIFSGGGLVITPEETVIDFSALYNLINKENVTFLDSTPSLLVPFLDYIYEQNSKVKSLKTLIFGSDYFPIDDYKRIISRFDDMRIINGYGITETTNESSYFESDIDYFEETSRGYVPIGRPLPNTRYYILNKSMQPQPIGVFGELYIGGDGVSRGYLNNSELTLKSFVSDLFNKNGRMYRTGDIARWREDGNVDFLGRQDHQVKIRGFRIELSEIESQLAQHKAVKEAVVIVQEHKLGGKKLVAFLVPKIKADINKDEIYKNLKKKLPSYMVPSVIIILEKMPLTPNGKVDRKELVSNLKEQNISQKLFIRPRNHLEYELQLIWEEILGLAPIGMHDDFFDIGGHSLLLIQMVSRIKKKLGKDVPLSAIYKGATIEDIAGLLKEESYIKPGRSLVEVQKHGSRKPLFFVHGAGGYIFGYTALFKLLGEKRPIYGLQISNPDSDFQTLEEIAEHYLNEIRTVQPKGPYQIAGHCFGGLVAFEMACQLKRDNEDVHFVGLLDSYLAEELNNNDIDDLKYIEDYALRMEIPDKDKLLKLEELKKMDNNELLAYLNELARTAPKFFPPDVDIDFVKKDLNIWINHSKAMDRYKPGTEDVPLVLFQAIDTTGDATRGWVNLTTRDFVVIPVEGGHGSLVRPPFVDKLVRNIDTFLLED